MRPERILKRGVNFGNGDLKRKILTIFSAMVLAFTGLVSTGLSQTPVRAEFIPLESALPVLRGMSDALPADLKAVGPLDSARWSAWVRRQDREVRNRLVRGEEDTLVNLLRFGVTFTSEVKIDDEYLVRYGQSSLVNAFAERRATDLIRAWMAPHPSAGLVEMRAFVEKRGHSLQTPSARQETKKYLLSTLARLRDDYLKYKSQPKDEARFQLFQDRGISLDSNLWPDYLLDRTFRALKEKGQLHPGSVRRIAIVGPGLDFANKEAGNDFYPPQTIQPFAVLDSLIRLGVVNPDAVELDTLDISENVNSHIDRIRSAAARGEAYTVQLPWNTQRPMSESYRANFISYWQRLGENIGDAATAIPVPEADTSTRTRAIRVRPALVAKVFPRDLNVVYQRLTVPPDRGYDLVIGTNIFLYYGAFEQSLARANIASMLRRGGFLISTDKLADKVTSNLEDVLELPVVMSERPLIRDVMFCYQRAN